MVFKLLELIHTNQSKMIVEFQIKVSSRYWPSYSHLQTRVGMDYQLPRWLVNLLNLCWLLAEGFSSSTLVSLHRVSGGSLQCGD